MSLSCQPELAMELSIVSRLWQPRVQKDAHVQMNVPRHLLGAQFSMLHCMEPFKALLE
jgi:hypothetical protein